MAVDLEKLQTLLRNKLSEKFGDKVLGISEAFKEVTIQVDREIIRELCLFLRDDPDFKFDLLAYATAVDESALGRTPRYQMAYNLYSVFHKHRVRVKAVSGTLEVSFDRLGGQGIQAYRVYREDARGDRVLVTTARGSYEAGRLVIAPGAWAPQLLRDLQLPLVVERNVLCWFEPRGGVEAFRPGRFPIYIWEVSEHVQFYGFPAQDGAPGGVKAALFRAGAHTTPETIDRSIHPADVEPLRAILATHIPDLSGPLIEAATCMYTTTPDEHFIVDLHPQHPNVVVASPCSGHGYKFASVIGEILARRKNEPAFTCRNMLT